MPPALEFSHLILKELSAIRREAKKMKYLRPDAKSQVTIEYNDANKPIRIDTIVISTQHDDFISASDNSPEAQQYADERMLDKIRIDIERILIPRVKQQLPRRLKKFFREDYRLFVNPTGKFVIGGPHGDTGLTGRKIIVDTYGGKGAHGGGAFSGKDSSKVDRSAAYAARHIAKNLVAAGIAKEVLIQVAYAIGVAEPVGLYVNTYGTSKVREKSGRKLTDSEISNKVNEIFDMRPAAIVKRLGLKNPIFLPTASYGHVGRDSYTKKVTVTENGRQIEKEVEFFTWEKLDYVDRVKKSFDIV